MVRLLSVQDFAVTLNRNINFRKLTETVLKTIRKVCHRTFAPLKILRFRQLSILLNSGESRVASHLELTRMESRKFPIRLSFAMEITKSQSQSFDKIQLYLSASAFGHTQIYVAFPSVMRCKMILSINQSRKN